MPPASHYDTHGHGYSRHRRAEPRIAARIHAALGDARTVVNVGAGAGSYEPEDRYVLAIEPSATMRAQRPAHLVPAISAYAEALPLDDASVDAAMAIITVHHWEDVARGLRELRRVARGPVVVLTLDLDAFGGYWLVADYGPELLAVERKLFPGPAEIAAALGDARIEPIPVPAGCQDGFVEAYYGRPEAYLDASVRSAQSVWRRLAPGVESRIVAALSDDLASGAWDDRHGSLRSQPEYESTLRLIVAGG